MDENGEPGEGKSSPAAGKPLIPSARTALLTLLAALALLMLSAWFIISGSLGPLNLMEQKFYGALALELLSLGLPLFVLFRLGRYDIRSSLGLHPASGLTLAGAVLAGIGLIAVAPQLEAWQSRIMPPPEGYMEGLTDLLSADSTVSLLLALLSLAVAPALLEEALFRGVLLRSALTRWGGWRSILGVGLAFGLFHLDLYRWPILALIGVLLTWIAVQANSLWPAVTAHLVNNSLAVLLVNLPAVSEEKWIEGVSDVPPGLFLAGVGLLLLGIVMVKRGSSSGGLGAPPFSSITLEGN